MQTPRTYLEGVLLRRWPAGFGVRVAHEERKIVARWNCCPILSRNARRIVGGAAIDRQRYRLNSVFGWKLFNVFSRTRRRTCTRGEDDLENPRGLNICCLDVVALFRVHPAKADRILDRIGGNPPMLLADRFVEVAFGKLQSLDVFLGIEQVGGVGCDLVCPQRHCYDALWSASGGVSDGVSRERERIASKSSVLTV